MKTLYEGILSDIDINMDKMDRDIRSVALSSETKNFEELVNAFVKFFDTDKPKVTKTTAAWKIDGSSLSKRFTGNKKVSFNFYSKSHNSERPPYGAVQIVDMGKSCSIRWVSYDIKHDFRTNTYSKSEKGLMWLDYRFDMSLIEYLTSTVFIKDNSTSRQLQTIISNIIKNPKTYKIDIK